MMKNSLKNLNFFKIRFLLSLVFSISLFLNFACTANSQKGRDNSIPTGDIFGGGTPPVDVDPKEISDPAFTPEEESCDSSSQVDMQVEVDGRIIPLSNLASLDFGLNQAGEIKCHTLNYSPSCARVITEITQSSAKTILSQDGDNVESISEFEVIDQGNPGKLDICYLRNFDPSNRDHQRLNPGNGNIRLHVGQLNIVAQGGFTTVVHLRGQTLPPIFSLDLPVDKALIWPGSNFEFVDHSDQNSEVYNQYIDRPYFRHYRVPVAGSVNANALHLLKSDQIKISVKGGGITSFTDLNRENLRFGHGAGGESVVAEIPSGPVFSNSPFEVEVGVDTIHGLMTLRRTLIPYTGPQYKLEAANQAGLVISETSAYQILAPTDTKQITAGVKIDNASLSAPNINSAACIKIRLKKGNEPFADIPEFTENFNGGRNFCQQGFVPLYLEDYPEEAKSTCSGNLLSSNQNGISYCVTIGDIKNRFSQGVNQFEATICTEHTRRMRTNNQDCLVTRTSIIVNNSKPQINFQRPTKNGVSVRSKLIELEEGEILQINGRIDNTQIFDEEGNCALTFKLNTSLASSNPDIDLCAGGEGAFEYLNIISGNQGRSRLSGYYNANGRQADYGVVTFSVPLSLDGNAPKLQYGKNLVRVTATNGRGHTTIGVYDFSIGKVNAVESNRNVGTLDTSLGFDPDGNGTKQAPLQFKFSKQTFDEDHPFVKVITKFMNEKLPFSKMVVGGGLRVDDDGNRLPIIRPRNNNNTEVRRLSTGSMPELFLAWKHYQGENGGDGFPLVDGECDINSDFGCDVMGKQMTTAIMSPHMFRYVADPPIDADYLASHINPRTGDRVGIGEDTFWPTFCLNDSTQRVGERFSADLECRKFPTIEGKWSVEDVTITEEGYINMTLNLNGRTDLTYRRDELSLRNNYARMPALMAPYFTFGLIEEGSFPLLRQEGRVGFLGNALDGFLAGFLEEGNISLAEGDLPIIANVDSIQIRFDEVIRLMRVELSRDGDVQFCGDEPCECRENSQSCTNYLHIDTEKVYEDEDLLEIRGYRDCARLITELLGDTRIQRIGLGANQGVYPENNILPYGCEVPNRRGDYPILIDTTSKIGAYLWNNLGEDTTEFLDIVNIVFDRTVRMKIAAMATQLHLPEGHQLAINSLIDSRATPYPRWFPVRDRVDDLDFSLVYNDGGENIEVKQTENIEGDDQVLVSIKPDLRNTEISTEDDITVKIPFSMGTQQVANLSNTGFTYQASDRDIELPIVDQDKPSMSGAIGIVQIANGLFRNILSKNIHPILNDLFDLSLEGPPGAEAGPTEVVIDTVTLGRLGICNSLLEIIDTRLPPSTLFSNVANYFTNDLAQLKITLDPESPPVISLTEPDHSLYGPVEEGRNDIPGTDVTLNIGLSNMTLDVYNLEESQSKFRPLDKVLSVGINMILKVDLKFVDNEIWIYIHPNKSQVIYFDVKDGAGSFHDPEVLENLWEQAVKVVVPQVSTEGVRTPSLKIRIPNKISEFSNINFIEAGDEDYFNNRPEQADGLIVESYLTNLAPNGECNAGEEPLYFNENRGPIEPDQRPENRPRNPYDSHQGEEIRELDLEGLVDICKFEAYVDENQLAEDFLCDLGINEMTIEPQIEFDTDTGSILFSTDLIVELIRGLEDYLNPNN